jgi:hypothetical protein
MKNKLPHDLDTEAAEAFVEQYVAARDTTFDNIIPKSIWISTRTTEDRIYVGDYDGILSSSHQISWILQKALKENEELRIKLENQCTCTSCGGHKELLRV